jgi:hypothetical protein
LLRSPSKSTSFSTSDFDLSDVHPCFFVDISNQGGTSPLLVDTKWEHKSSEVKIPILMEDEDRNPLVECHRQEMINEYVWSMNILEGSTLESKKEDHVDEYQSYILEEPQDPRFREKSPDLIFSSTNYTYESCNHPILLFYQILKRMVVDAFVYHKYSKAHSCLGASSCS